MNTRDVTRYAVCSGLVFTLVACSDKIDGAVQAAKALSAMGEEAKVLAAAAEKASAAAKQQAQQQIAAGTDPNVAKQQVDMAGGLAAMQAMGAAGGPVANWRDLAPFVPETVGAFAHEGELDGSTDNMAGMQVTKVERNYKAGTQSADISITDANMVAMLKMPFAMIAMINEDSTRGFKKGKTVSGQPAIVEWEEQSKQSKVVMLVGNRFILEIRVEHADSNDAAEKLAALINVSGLAQLKTAAPTP
jgi:hypothetical protein